jgi:regulatory protein
VEEKTLENRPSKPQLTQTQLTLRGEKYCAYQERSHQQVRDKLYDLGGNQEEVENIIVHLIQTNFLNEERFAEAYVRGKFNIKRWGKFKIQTGLKKHRVDAKMIRKALAQIDQDEYLEVLRTLLNQKKERLKEKNLYKRKASMVRFASQRGFESDLIYDMLREK